MPPSPFLGFSALTGEVSESHESVLASLRSLSAYTPNSHYPLIDSIIAITTSSLILNQDLVSSAGPSRRAGKGRTPSSGRGFFGTLFSLILRLIFLAAIVAVGFVGWRAYGARLKGMGGGKYAKGGVVWDSKRF